MFKKGDIVAYRTKDIHGYREIMAKVTKPGLESSCISTLDSHTPLMIPNHVLTKIKTVWQDTMKEVKP